LRNIAIVVSLLLSLFASAPSFAASTSTGPCLSGICIGQPFSEIANRQWVTDDTSFWNAPDQASFNRIPISEPVRSELNAPKVANLGFNTGVIRSQRGLELLQQAHFCGAYAFELLTPDEHGWDTMVTVLPTVSDGRVELRVVQLTKTINQPLITQEQSAQRLQNFNTQFAAYQHMNSPYMAQLNGSNIAVVFLSYRKEMDDMLAEQNNHLRTQPGCQQASAGF